MPQYHDRMGFSETIFLFLLALLIFGPKRLPEIARQVGKFVNELKRASSEFQAQIQTEISQLELQEQRKALTGLPSVEPPAGSIASSTPATLAEPSPTPENPETPALKAAPDA